jgi:hydrogenase nickel incorporation protein HypA/HybF
MHELAVTESILQIALRHLPQGENLKIANVYLVIGQLSSIVDDSVQFYWDILTKDTPASHSILHFKRIPAEFLCLNCDTRYHPDKDLLECPTCGGSQVKIIAGEEFYIEAIDVEEITFSQDSIT